MYRNFLPGQQQPYFLESGEGQRYLLGLLLVTIIGRRQDTGSLMEGVVLLGAKNAVMPLHRHTNSHHWANNAIPGEALSPLLLMINGPVLLAFSPNFTNGIWTEFSAQWSSGTASTEVIQIADTTAIALGDDFALDDLSFTAVPEPSSLALLGIALAYLCLRKRRRKQPV